MIELPSFEITAQVSRARILIEHHLATTLKTIHLFGSALNGDLKPHSDIDLLVTVTVSPAECVRRNLMLDLLTISSPPGYDRLCRPLEVTVIAQNEVVPWRYPARRELQFGEWLRHDLLAGIVEPAVLDPDLAILLTKARQSSIALIGSSAAECFEPVPKVDFNKALLDTITQWNSEIDWKGDERNVVLALSRIWYSASTGKIASKDAAATWVLEQLPVEHRPVVLEAKAAYLGINKENFMNSREKTTAFIFYAKSAIKGILLGRDGL